jgi:hypothetical protein
MQVYFLPEIIEVDPAFLQGVPAFIAPKATVPTERLNNRNTVNTDALFFMT